MVKPPKTPRPPKPPVVPMRPGHEFLPYISLSQEKLVGRVVVAWSKLENSMDDLLWSLLGVEIEKGRIVTGRMDAVAKIRAARQLGELELPTDDFHSLSALLDRIDLLREDRNFIVHGSWGTSLPDATPHALSLRPKGLSPDEVVSETFDRSRMDSIVAAIEKEKRQLIGILKKRGTWPDRSRPPPGAD